MCRMEQTCFSVDLRVVMCLVVISQGKAECVKDLPAMQGSLQDWKPGLYYGVDDQCRIAFGSTARACSFADVDSVSACNNSVRTLGGGLHQQCSIVP